MAGGKVFLSLRVYPVPGPHERGSLQALKQKGFKVRGWVPPESPGAGMGQSKGCPALTELAGTGASPGPPSHSEVAADPGTPSSAARPTAGCPPRRAGGPCASLPGPRPWVSGPRPGTCAGIGLRGGLGAWCLSFCTPRSGQGLRWRAGEDGDSASRHRGLSRDDPAHLRPRAAPPPRRCPRSAPCCLINRMHPTARARFWITPQDTKVQF